VHNTRAIALKSIQWAAVPACAVLLCGLAAVAAAKGHASPKVPDSIKAPAGEKVVFHAQASGAQIYLCQPGSDCKPQWILKGPEADLHDSKGAVVGHHFAGPAWKHVDGSEVTGKAVARVDAPESDSIPWLLLTATTHSGTGVLDHVTSIQRIHTKGGNAPQASTCDASKVGTEAKSPYSAQYYFYAP
jgi:hypothetical protein